MIADVYDMGDLPNLLPCPFCGEREYKYFEYENKDCFYQCAVCTTCGPNGADKESATWQWNNRPSEIKLDACVRGLVYAIKRAMAHKTSSTAVIDLLSDGMVKLGQRLRTKETDSVEDEDIEE